MGELVHEDGVEDPAGNDPEAVGDPDLTGTPRARSPLTPLIRDPPDGRRPHPVEVAVGELARTVGQIGVRGGDVRSVVEDAPHEVLHHLGARRARHGGGKDHDDPTVAPEGARRFAPPRADAHLHLRSARRSRFGPVRRQCPARGRGRGPRRWDDGRCRRRRFRRPDRHIQGQHRLHRRGEPSGRVVHGPTSWRGPVPRGWLPGGTPRRMPSPHP